VTGLLLMAAAFAASVGRGNLSSPDAILQFNLGASPAAVVQVMGGQGYQSNLPQAIVLEFRDESEDLDDDPVWRFYFQNPGSRLAVVTRNFEKGADVSSLFPAETSSKHFVPNAQKPMVTLLSRPAGPHRILIAVMQQPNASLAGQLVLTTPEHAALLFPVLSH